MTVNPDTDVIYNEAVALQGRMEEYAAKEKTIRVLARDEELKLLSNGFLPDADPEVRLRAAQLRVSQIIQEEHTELFDWLDEEGAAIRAIQVRNEGIVAAGWAEQFAYNSETRRLTSKWSTPPKGELEA